MAVVRETTPAAAPEDVLSPNPAARGIRVSILISARNEAATIERSLQSAAAAMGADDEVVAIDDGSTDDTGRRIEAALSSVRHSQVIRTPGLGLTRALRLGAERARGRFIARLDAGDTMVPERIDLQLREFDRDPRVVLCAGNARFVDRAGRALSASSVPLWDASNVIALLLLRNPLIHSTWMVRRDALLAAGNYREAITCSQDYDLALRLLRFGRIRNVASVLGDYLIADDGISATRLRDQRLYARMARADFLASIPGVHRLVRPPTSSDWDSRRVELAHSFARRAIAVKARGAKWQAAAWRTASAMTFPLPASVMGVIRILERLRFGSRASEARQTQGR
jgi:glycosyltransferase involved in cell wall biosynthesis